MKKIHLIGLAGIGISGLARIFLERGDRVSGSDLKDAENLEALRKLGAKIFIGHKKENLSPDTDLVVYSAAVPQDNPEIIEAKEKRIKVQTYARALGDLTKDKFTIAISGMHGKSTTASLIALILEKAGLDPTVIVGTKIKQWQNSNARAGKSKYLVIEADEWQASFLNYWPQILVLTNIEEEHLDFYQDLTHILETFKKYLQKLPSNGILIANKDDKNIAKIAKITKVQKIFFSSKDQEIGKIKSVLKIPGQHNLLNALAALKVARTLKINDEISYQVFKEFKGIWRRFEIIGQKNGAIIVSDFAHHPTEIQATLKAAKEKYPNRRLVLAFQPHQHNRTKKLFKDFTRSFNPADLIIFSEIYDVAGREADKDQDISSKDLAKEVEKQGKETLFARDLEETKKLILDNIKENDLVIVMGAGDIYQIANQLIAPTSLRATERNEAIS